MICAAIPADELAVQWDVAVEMGVLEGAFPAPFDNVEETVAAAVVALARRCLQTSHSDTTCATATWAAPLHRAPRHVSAGRTGQPHLGRPDRPLDWMHMPVPRDRDDPEYFAPLAGLRLAETADLFLAGSRLGRPPRCRRRMGAASKFRAGFGIATECGFGRRDPRSIPALLQLHRDVAVSAERPVR